MTGALDLGRVDELHVRLTYGRSFEGPVHDVFVLDTRPGSATGSFDERPYLELLEPVLQAPGGDRAPAVVHLNRTHRSGVEGPDEAEIVVALATGRSTPVERAVVDTVGSAFRTMLDRAGAEPPAELLDHDHALLEARLRLARGYAGVDPDLLSVSDEEHGPAPGTWSVGLVLAGRARFGVRIGFVDGDARTTHIRRLRGSEVVDSLGTGGAG